MDARLLERFSGVVDRIYEAALRPDAWPEALRSIAELQNSPKCLLLTPYRLPRDGGMIMAHGISQAGIRLWESRLFGDDVVASTAMERGLVRNGNVLLVDDILPLDEYRKSTIYRELYVPLDMYHIQSGIVFDGVTDRTGPTICAAIRGHDAPAFTRADCRLHALTIGHLSRAIGTVLRLRDADYRLACSVAALDRIASCIVLFGERAQVLFANQAARAMFGAQDGLSLRPGNPLRDQCGWICAAMSREDDALRKDLNAAVLRDPMAARHFATGLAISRPSGKPPYIVRISSLALEAECMFEGIDARAVAFINDPVHPLRVDSQILGRVFGLSPAESQVAQELLVGDSLDTVARRLAVSENTVKTHLQRIYEKTGTHRQAQLVRLLVELASASTCPPRNHPNG